MITLYAHQIESVEFKLANPRSFDISTCGCGKTISTLEAWRRRGKGKLMTLAPKSTLEAVWYNDAHALHGSHKIEWFDRKKTRDKSYMQRFIADHDFVVLNYEAVNLALLENLEDYDTLVIDEFTAIKNRTAQRSKAILKLSQGFENINLLSGTPTPNGLVDIWHPAYVLDAGQRLGANFFQFRSAIAKPVEEGTYKKYIKWVEIPGAIDVVGEELRDITIRHVLEEVVDMPERINRTVSITMPPKLRKDYETMKSTAILELAAGDVTAVNKAVLGNKLLQLCVASDTEVLTDTGWIEIQNIKTNHKIWDGNEWVNYDKLLDNGYATTINCWGVEMTPTHLVSTTKGWQQAQAIANDKSSTQFKRSNFQLPYSNKTSRIKTHQWRIDPSPLVMSMYMWQRNNTIQPKYTTQKSNIKKLWMQAWRNYKNTWQNKNQHIIQSMVKNKISMQFPIRQRLYELRRAWDQTLQAMGQFSILPRRYGSLFSNGTTARQDRQQQRIFKNKLQMGYCFRAIEQHESKSIYKNTIGEINNSSSSTTIWDKTRNNIRKIKSRMERRTGTKKHVYDLLNVGSRNQYLVRNKQGYEFIVHNCSGSLYTEDGSNATLDTTKYEFIVDLVKEREASLVFFIWRHQRLALEKILVKDKVPYAYIDGSVSQSERNRIIQDFQNGKYQTVLLQPAAAAHGITLTRSTASIWCSPTWNLEHFLQANYRDYRIGQTKRSECIMVAYKDTIEEDVYKRLTEKKQNLTDLLTILRT